MKKNGALTAERQRKQEEGNTMNAAVILFVGIVVLACGYLFYGRWLAKTWGIDPSRKTPAVEYQDGVDYVTSKAPVLMGHHF